MELDDAKRQCQDLIPFRFLSRAQDAALWADLRVQTFAIGDVLVEPDQVDAGLHIVLQGEIAVSRPASKYGPGLDDRVEAGTYFGARASLFGGSAGYYARAIAPGVCAIIPRGAYLEALASSPVFAQAIGDMLRVSKGLLEPFDAFMAALLHDIRHKRIDMGRLVALYCHLDPALHRGLREPETDFDALSYACARLPENITRTYALFLTDTLPDIYARFQETHFKPVFTRARRRTVVEMTPGKSMILLRDGVSDLVDLVTCLCVLMVEARKLRHRVTRPLLDAFARQAPPYPIEALDHVDALTEADREGLRGLWGDDAAQRLYELMLHHEDFNLEIEKQLDGYHTRHTERWIQQLAAGVLDLLGSRPRDLPEDYPVHIISSNTHSVSNCLSPFLHQHAEALHAWAQTHTPDLLAEPWADPTDALYAASRAWFKADPDRPAQRLAEDREHGILSLEATAFTGIEVELIDLERLCKRRLDPGLTPPPSDSARGLIVNIDYAFGQQAEEIISHLIVLFGARIRSINVLGKAGALVGERGDLLAADTFIEQTSDMVARSTHTSVDLDRLAARCPDRDLFVGPMLTVAGTLLQNHTMLHFYHHIWRCVGLEMEGTYYLRHILKAQTLGILPRDIPLRFLYYVSDLPLAPHATLAGPLRPSEGIPPLYAITREILQGIFDTMRAEAAPVSAA